MKFSKMPYSRPELDETRQTLTRLIEAFERAETPKAAFAAYKEIDTFLTHLYTMQSLAYVRNTMDTNDEFYDAENTFFDENMPLIEELEQRLNRSMLDSPHRRALEDEFGSLMFRNIEIKLKTFAPEIVPDLQEENRLATEYAKLLASAQIEYDGQTYTLAQIMPFHESPDRDVRKGSMEARAGWFMAHAEELDTLFDKLVRVRTGIARKLGFENYVELGYCRMSRNCYDQEMVEGFRKNIREHIVPLAVRLKKEQAERIGVPAITVYDDTFSFPTGNAKPVGTPDEIMTHGRKMYHEMSPETTEFIDVMMENELFDVLTRPGKTWGGYCTTFPEYKAQFVFANFNGTADDVDVLTHEAGHAYAFYSARDIYPTRLQEPAEDICEVHSMSMEFFAWPWMEGFFGDQARKYYYSHLAEKLTFLPYGAMVDEFQHRIYASPDMTPAERNALWLELEGIYRPYLELEGFPFYGEGRRWQAQLHIYEYPFYYIDYCLAASMALSFWAQSQEDYPAAWSKYQTLVSFAGTKTFLEQVQAVGLPNPFEDGALASLSKAAVNWLAGRNGSETSN